MCFKANASEKQWIFLDWSKQFGMFHFCIFMRAVGYNITR